MRAILMAMAPVTNNAAFLAPGASLRLVTQTNHGMQSMRRHPQRYTDACPKAVGTKTALEPSAPSTISVGLRLQYTRDRPKFMRAHRDCLQILTFAEKSLTSSGDYDLPFPARRGSRITIIPKVVVEGPKDQQKPTQLKICWRQPKTV